MKIEAKKVTKFVNDSTIGLTFLFGICFMISISPLLIIGYGMKKFADWIFDD